MITAKVESLIQNPFYVAQLSDLDFLVALEEECFEDYRRSSCEIIKRSIVSETQIVVIINDDESHPVGSITLRVYKKQVRIVSIAVKKGTQGKNLGSKMLQKAIEFGYFLDLKIVSLEVDANNNALIRWYESFGFEQVKILEDYYSTQKHAVKMEMYIKDPNKYIIITDFDTDFFDDIDNVKHLRATEYFDSEIYQNAKDVRVFNFCANYKYQSVGYYVSLLALARNQVAYPSAGLIRDIDNQKVIKSIGEEINELIQESLYILDDNEVIINSYFGKSDIETYQKLINGLNMLYQTPLIQYSFVKKDVWFLRKIKVLGLEDTMTMNCDKLKTYAKNYFEDKHFVRSSLKYYQYDMAILVDPNEKMPPSDKKALDLFKKAAEHIGFYVEFITKRDFSRIPEFDALFIRTTSNVNDYTYDFARYAYAEGLVVMDDPWSILRCANKIYLYEALKNAKVPMPRTWVINKKSNYIDKISEMAYPIILKLPDSAFSAGVYKVKSKTECIEKLKVMFKRSELIIAQEFMPTDYDWRIGILDGELLYACKYYMVKDHWQIINWENEEGDCHEGAYEAINLMDVPRNVLVAALKAASTIGEGLYGVDLKVKGLDVYVIEVNDNPNVDYMVEDAVEGSSIYIKIMMSFYNRIENSIKMLRTIS